MEVNKEVAKKEITVLQGEPSVIEYYNESESKTIDILSCKNSIQEGICAYATIGLNKINIGLEVDLKSLRIELVGACDIQEETFGNIISSAAFELMDKKSCFPGLIIENVIQQYIGKTDMKHVLLTAPFLWEDLGTICINEMYVTWLLLVPISENERKYAEEKSSDALEDLFVECQIDIFDIYRKSVI